MTVQSPPPGAPPAAKKGIPPLGWVAIGCGAIVVLVLAGMMVVGFFVKSKIDQFAKNPTMAGAKLIVAANPDLEIVSSDDTANTFTIHNKKTNETVTINAEDIKNGRMKFTTDKGSMTIDGTNQNGGGVVKMTDDKGQTTVIAGGSAAPKDLPSWLPVYPGAETRGGVSTRSTTADGNTATFTLTTSDSVDQVINFYKDRLTSSGFTVQPPTSLASGGVTSMATLTAQSTDKKWSATVIATRDAGKNQTSAAVSYQMKP